MSSPPFYVLSEHLPSNIDADSTSQVEEIGNASIIDGPISLQRPTHDTSRLGWHMKDLQSWAKDIEIVSDSCSRVQLLMYFRPQDRPSRITAALDIDR
jgi:hypothetical protein